LPLRHFSLDLLLLFVNIRPCVWLSCLLPKRGFPSRLRLRGVGRDIDLGGPAIALTSPIAQSQSRLQLPAIAPAQSQSCAIGEDHLGCAVLIGLEASDPVQIHNG
jgi:hypothetical protein